MTRIGGSDTPPTPPIGGDIPPPPPYEGEGTPLQPYPPGGTSYAYVVAQPGGTPPPTYSPVQTRQGPSVVVESVVPVIDDGSGGYPVVVDGNYHHHHHHHYNQPGAGVELSAVAHLGVGATEDLLKGAEIVVKEGASVAVSVGRILLEEAEDVGKCMSCLAGVGKALCGLWECIKGLGACLGFIVECLGCLADLAKDIK